jgi:hypothetical protein
MFPKNEKNKIINLLYKNIERIKKFVYCYNNNDLQNLRVLITINNEISDFRTAKISKHLPITEDKDKIRLTLRCRNNSEYITSYEDYTKEENYNLFMNNVYVEQNIISEINQQLEKIFPNDITVNEKIANQKVKIEKLRKEYEAGHFSFVSKFIKRPDFFQVNAMKKVFDSLIKTLEFDRINADTITKLAKNDVNIWNYLLINWLKEENSAYYVNKAIKDGMAKDKEDIFSILKAGQYLEIRELYDGMFKSLQSD